MAAPGVAVPGSVVAIGSQASPAGAQGIQGTAGPSTPSANTGNLLTTGTDSLLYLPPSAIDPEIWIQRLRSFNSVGNPNFEVDQRQCNLTRTIAGGSDFTFLCDRWSHVKTTPTLAYQAQATPAQTVSVPGTSYQISNSYAKITTTVQQTTLAAGDISSIQQAVEGPQLRALFTDVHSVSILATTNVTGGLKFALSLRDPTNTRSLCKLSTLTTPGVWQLITLPNLPVFPVTGGFSLSPGAAGLLLNICFAAGTTYMPSANDTWQTGNFVGAIGMDNLGAKPIGSQLIIAFVQHEPGPVCSTLTDKPFTQNYDECLRYYQKSATYNQLANTTTNYITGSLTNQLQFMPGVGFQKPMAKMPTVVIYDANNGSANVAYNVSKAIHHSPSNAGAITDKGYGFVQVSSGGAVSDMMIYNYTADTGW